MSLRNKILILFGLLFSLLGGTFYLLQATLLLPTFERLESEQIERDLLRIQQAFRSEIDHLDTLAGDWAAWDDTYAFVQDANPAFVKSNLVPATFVSSELNLVSILDLKGRPVYSQGMDLQQEVSLDPAELVSELDDPHSPLLLARPGATEASAEWVQKGLILGPRGWLLVSARPILTSEDQGPARGTLIMGRLLGDSLLARLRDQTRVEFNIDTRIQPIDASAPRLAIQNLSDELAGGELKLSSVDGKSALLISARFPRSIYQQGMLQLSYLWGFVLLLLAISLAVCLWFIGSRVVAPMTRLTEFVHRLQETSDLSLRCKPESLQETAKLARAFNGLLEQLQSQDRSLEHYTRRLRYTNRVLEQQATEDALTGLANRRKLDQVLARAWAQARRDKRPLALLMCDIDHFKAFNDHYGHPAGDRCLGRVAGLITARAKRPMDLAARYGGEEFVVLLPGTDSDGAEQIAELLQKALADENIPHLAAPDERRLTLSIGIASWIPEPSQTHGMLLQAADRALYRAKRGGRNRVERADTLPGADIVHL